MTIKFGIMEIISYHCIMFNEEERDIQIAIGFLKADIIRFKNEGNQRMVQMCQQMLDQYYEELREIKLSKLN